MEITSDYFRDIHEKIFVPYEGIIGVKSPSARPKWSFATERWSIELAFALSNRLLASIGSSACAQLQGGSTHCDTACDRILEEYVNRIGKSTIIPTSFRYNAYLSFHELDTTRVSKDDTYEYRLILLRWILTSVNAVQFSGRRE